jgi:hypothetical protein
MIRVWLIALLIVLVACPSWAAIVFVGSQTGSFLGTNSNQTINFALTGGTDAAPLADDFVIITYCYGGIADGALIVDAPDNTDYTLFGTEQYRDDTSDVNMRTAYRVMPGTPETQFILGETGAGGSASTNNGAAYTVFVFRGVHATPLEQAVQQGVGFDTMLVNPGGITPTTAGTYIYVAGCGALSGTGGTYTQGDLTGFITSTAADTVDANIGAGYLAWTAGAYNPATFGGGGTDTIQASYAWMIVALAPAADVAGPGVSGNTGALMLLGVER